MKTYISLSVLAGLVICAITMAAASDAKPDHKLKIVIIRHAEKPENGDNLSCQGLNRAMQLPDLLDKKFKIPEQTYVPALDCGKSTTHSRMFQTVTPFAVKHNLQINSKFDANDFSQIVPDVFQHKGTVLMVWEHSEIQHLAQALGASKAKEWDKLDFDSIWIITFPNGKATLDIEQQKLDPKVKCAF